MSKLPRATTPPPNALFAEMLRAARELLALRSPLDAELMVSEMLGTWWGQRSPRTSGHRGADLEEVIGEGLVEYAGQDASPAALALLSGIACLGTPRQAALAEKAGLALIERGVARPAWSEHVGAVAAAECYVNSDIFGDGDEAVCLFSYAGTDPHALVMMVNYNAGGLLRDGWVTSKVAALLERCRPAGLPPDRPVRGAFRLVSAGQARRLLEAALTATDAATDPPVSESFPAYHAFIRARIRTLHRRPPSRTAPRSAAPPPRWPATTMRRAGWERRRGGRPGATTAAPCWWWSSSPPTRPRTCRTARRPAGARMTSSITAAARISGARCG